MKKATIIILHGWGLSGKRFSGLAHELEKKNYRVLTPDLPGFGESSIPDHPLHLLDYAEFLSDYLKTKKIKNPILLGHSFGGRVSLVYAKVYPKNVRALILSGTPGFSPIAKKKLILFIVLAKLGGFLFSIPPLSLLQNEVRTWYYYVVGARDFFRAEGPMRETFKTVVREELVSAMQSIRIPCLLIWGEYDILVPSSIADRMKEVMPQAKLVIIPEADHGVPFKEPSIFASYVDRFLSTL